MGAEPSFSLRSSSRVAPNGTESLSATVNDLSSCRVTSMPRMGKLWLQQLPDRRPYPVQLPSLDAELLRRTENRVWRYKFP